MPSIFTRIINREIPGQIVAEDERFIAFLDIMPLVTGHTLVVPKQEVDHLFDLEPDTLADLMVFARRVAAGVRRAVPCKRIGLSVIGLEVPHAHVHLVPLNQVDDINFTRPKLNPSPEELAEVADRIRQALQQP